MSTHKLQQSGTESSSLLLGIFYSVDCRFFRWKVNTLILSLAPLISSMIEISYISGGVYCHRTSTGSAHRFLRACKVKSIFNIVSCTLNMPQPEN
jgi:hypothetical protein